MRTLRRFSLITRLVLAWFVLSLGVAVASPIVNPQDVLLVCSGSGAMKIVVQGDDDNPSGTSSNTMDCPLCTPFVSPLLSTYRLPEPSQRQAHALPLHSDPLRGGQAAPPLVARGPPAL